MDQREIAKDFLGQLVRRYGEQMVMEWIRWAETASNMTINTIQQLTDKYGGPVSPDAIVLCLRFPHARPEGLCLAVGAEMMVGRLSAMDTDEKQRVITETIRMLEEESDWFPPPRAEAAERKPPSILQSDGGAAEEPPSKTNGSGDPPEVA